MFLQRLNWPSNELQSICDCFLKKNFIFRKTTCISHICSKEILSRMKYYVTYLPIKLTCNSRGTGLTCAVVHSWENRLLLSDSSNDVNSLFVANIRSNSLVDGQWNMVEGLFLKLCMKVLRSLMAGDFSIASEGLHPGAILALIQIRKSRSSNAWLDWSLWRRTSVTPLLVTYRAATELKSNKYNLYKLEIVTLPVWRRLQNVSPMHAGHVFCAAKVSSARIFCVKIQ